MLTNINLWTKPPVFEGDEDKSRAGTLLNIILWIFIVAASAYGMLAPIEPEFRIRRLIIIGPFVLLLLGLKQMLNMGYVRSTGNIIVITLWLMFTTAMFFGADYNNPAFMGYLVVVVCAGLILNWRAAIGWSIFSILTNAVILTLGQRGILSTSHGETPPFAFWTAQTVYIIVTAILLSQALRKIDESLKKAQHEINERKRVEVEREMFIKELETKNAELERFTYTVSHDLKSPLITIGGYIGFLEKNVHAGKMTMFDNDVQRIREAAGKMQDLLNDLLDLSRVGRLVNPSQEVDFGMIVQDALFLVDEQLRTKNIQVTVQESFPTVFGDYVRLVEVIQNLIDNAAKFMGEQPQPQIKVGVSLEDTEPVFFVQDNGIGIHEEHHDRIFGLFNKLDSTSEGTGIGLALVKRIIETHGGRIWVSSNNIEPGSTFFFTLPQKEQNNEPQD
ncbi:MAG: GHKL domain-containing protein [Anaerolineales bacterium]|nr:GHKL domain-containing protein [Anaerolineales bacterium]